MLNSAVEIAVGDWIALALQEFEPTIFLQDTQVKEPARPYVTFRVFANRHEGRPDQSIAYDEGEDQATLTKTYFYRGTVSVQCRGAGADELLQAFADSIENDLIRSQVQQSGIYPSHPIGPMQNLREILDVETEDVYGQDFEFAYTHSAEFDVDYIGQVNVSGTVGEIELNGEV